VRRAFLCGTDLTSQQSFEHRRQWIEDKLLHLASIFAIDLCAYAVMSNHYHAVLHVDAEAARAWSAEEVITRWHQLFKGSPLTQRLLEGDTLLSAEQAVAAALIEEWRSRLMNISWFMRIVNEAIARQANREDDCSGHFWEGRFKSQALLDEKALAVCMAYVDLNPIRAKMAQSPEQSDHTSAKKRITIARTAHSPNQPEQQATGLMSFVGNPRQEMPKGLPFRLSDYLELLDWTGRILRGDKRGTIASTLPPILERLDIDPRHWLYTSQHFESRFRVLVGTAFSIQSACKKLGYRRRVGISASALLS
jgi:REP element-mobilizing transposase RayT